MTTISELMAGKIPADHALALAYQDVIANGQRVGTVKRWLQSHDGQRIDTLQAGSMPWHPGVRTLATSATFATFDNSTRYYAGLSVISATADVMLCHDGRMDTEILYRVANLQEWPN